MRWNNRLYRTFCVLFATFIFIATGLYYTFRPNAAQARAEQYAVYSAYIEDGLTGDSHSLGNRQGTVLIGDVPMATTMNTVQQFRFMIGSFLNLYKRPSRPRLLLMCRLFFPELEKSSFDRRFNMSADYELLDAATLSSPKVHERFPRSYGYLTFSSVAFSADLVDALFYTEHICGLCGGGEYVLMGKIHGSWTIINRYGTWVS
jgi:hypothetical protein